MNVLTKTVNGVLDGVASGVKAFTMAFARGASYLILPRTHFNYGSDVGQGLQNSIVLAVIGWATRNVPQIPILINELREEDGVMKRDAVLPADFGPGRVLQLLLYPNTFYSGLLMMKAILIDYMTTGNAYLVKIKSAAGRVEELWWIPSVLIEPKWPTSDPTVYISHYEYNPNGTPYSIEPDAIIHFRDGLDPRNTRKGLNRLAALAREIFTDDEASNYSATLLKNLGVPGVIISPESTGIAAQNRITDPEGVKTSFMEKFSGDKRGEPMVLTAPTKVQVLSFSPQQMNLKDLRRLPEERLTAVFGIAAIVAGLGAGLDRSTFANMQEARAAAMEEFGLPTLEAILTDIRFQLLNDFTDPFKHEMVPDRKNVPLLAEDQDKVVERNVKSLAAGGITRRRFKENIGEETDEETDDVYYIPSSVVVVNANEPPPPLESELPTTPPPNPLTDTTPVEPAVPATNGNGNGGIAVA